MIIASLWTSQPSIFVDVYFAKMHRVSQLGGLGDFPYTGIKKSDNSERLKAL